ncbi:MAG: UDP-N-acetylmuramoyl-L-alanine--D-glutamate ligase [Candidatus Neomarinimicrobiota bacterium]
MDITDRNNIDLQDRRVAIIGLSRSGFAAARLARHLGAEVFVSDSSAGAAVTGNLAALRELGIDGEIDGHSQRIYSADLWVLSPGIAQDAEIVNQARVRSIPIVSEIEFSSWFTSAPVLAITGSNGKTTTAFALARMCQTDTVHGVLAGNMGVPFAEMVLRDLNEPDPARVFVLEISSFQMEFIRHFRPRVSVFLNISPDHLDRYHSMDEYVTAKMKLAANAGDGDFIVYNHDDAILSERLHDTPARLVPFSVRPADDLIYSIEEKKILTQERATLISLDEVALPGYHNYANLLAAATAAHLYGISDQTIATVMQTYQGVAHRLEEVAKVDGVRYINDSKATNLDAVKVALQSFPGPIILILGGKDKGGDFTELVPLLTNRVKKIIAIGQARERIRTALWDAARPELVEGLRDAVEVSRKCAKPGDVVLLSPGCASFDQFRDFEDRGDQFRQLTQALEQTT